MTRTADGLVRPASIPQTNRESSAIEDQLPNGRLSGNLSFATRFLAHKALIPRTPFESFVGTTHPQFTDNTGAGRFRLVPYSYFFSNSIQFRITVIGSDAASGRTELMRNFWPSGIAAQRWPSAKPVPEMGTVNKATGAPVR